jgi:hypothetical protein
VRSRAAIVSAFAAGAIVGAALVFALPVPGAPDQPGTPSQAGRAVLGEAPVSTLLAWTPGRLPDDFPAAVRGLRAIRSVAVVRSGVVWMSRWETGSGRTQRPPRGLQVPVEAASIHPKSYARFVPPAERDLVRTPGSVILGRTFAESHGLLGGGTVVLGRARLAVEGVLDDELIGAHEVMVQQPIGTRLGVVRPRYLLVAPDQDTSPAAAEGAIRRAVPAGVRVRIRAPGETPVFRHGDAVLPQVAIKEIFGEFAAAPRSDGTLSVDPAWVRSNIRSRKLPILGTVRCHRLLLPLVRGALEDLSRRGLGQLVDPGDFGGCYYPRFIARDPGTGLSHHSWGVAIDVNVSQGLPGRTPSIDRRVVEAFERWGFTWGGRFLIPDGTHFEFLRFPVSSG